MTRGGALLDWASFTVGVLATLMVVWVYQTGRHAERLALRKRLQGEESTDDDRIHWRDKL